MAHETTLTEAVYQRCLTFLETSATPTELWTWLNTVIPKPLFQQLEQLALLSLNLGMEGFCEGRTPNHDDMIKFLIQAGIILEKEIGKWLEKTSLLPPDEALAKFIAILAAIRKSNPATKEYKAGACEIKFQSVVDHAKLAAELHVCAANKALSAVEFSEKLCRAIDVAAYIVNEPDAKGDTLFHQIARNRDIPKLIMLLQAQCFNPCVRNKLGETPADLWRPSSEPSPTQGLELRNLIAAKLANDGDSIKLFVENLAKIFQVSQKSFNEASITGKTPLFWAIDRNHPLKVSALLFFGARPSSDEANKWPHPSSHVGKLLLAVAVAPREAAAATPAPLPAEEIIGDGRRVLPPLYEYARLFESSETKLTPELAKVDSSKDMPDFLKYERSIMAELVISWEEHLMPHLPRGKKLNIVSFGAGGLQELPVLILLCKEKGIDFHLWAFDIDQDVINIAQRRHRAHKQYFTYERCDAADEKALKATHAYTSLKEDGADALLMRQPDVKGDTSPLSRTAFDVMTKKTIPYVLKPDGLVFMSWFMPHEVEISRQSMDAVPGVYTPLVPPALAKHGSDTPFIIDGKPQLQTDRYTAVYRCTGLAFKHRVEGSTTRGAPHVFLPTPRVGATAAMTTHSPAATTAPTANSPRGPAAPPAPATISVPGP